MPAPQQHRPPTAPAGLAPQALPPPWPLQPPPQKQQQQQQPLLQARQLPVGGWQPLRQAGTPLMRCPLLLVSAWQRSPLLRSQPAAAAAAVGHLQAPPSCRGWRWGAPMHRRRCRHRCQTAAGRLAAAPARRSAHLPAGARCPGSAAVRPEQGCCCRCLPPSLPAGSACGGQTQGGEGGEGGAQRGCEDRQPHAGRCSQHARSRLEGRQAGRRAGGRSRSLQQRAVQSVFHNPHQPPDRLLPQQQRPPALHRCLHTQ